MRASIGAVGSSYMSFIPFLLKSIQPYLYISVFTGLYTAGIFIDFCAGSGEILPNKRVAMISLFMVSFY